MIFGDLNWAVRAAGSWAKQNALLVSLALLAALPGPLLIAVSMGSVLRGVLLAFGEVILGLLFLQSFGILGVNRKIALLERTIGSLWGLSGLLGWGKWVPSLGDSALSGTAAQRLAEQLVLAFPKTVVELGPGTSTVITHLVCSRLGLGTKIFCIEHDPSFVSRMQAIIDYLEMDSCVLIEAPLEDLRLDNWTGRWYSLRMLERLPPQIDFLVVDGPPGPLVKNARFPALPVLYDRLTPGAIIFVDDTDRPDESKIVGDWCENLPLKPVHTGEGFVVLEKP